MLLLAVVPVLAVGSPGCHFSRAPMHPETPPGSWYVVSRGETLDDIAKRAGVPAEDILELNGLARAEDVKPGRLIFVLAPQEPSSEPLPSHPNAGAGGGRAAARHRALPLAARQRRAQRRLAVRLARRALARRIDLPAPTGTPVVAAADGEVVYAGDGIRGYGNLVVLQHPGDLLTVYAHNSALFVAQGQAVRAGERIAAVGQTGRATGPHLHFEVRQGQIPRDPMGYLLAGGP